MHKETRLPLNEEEYKKFVEKFKKTNTRGQNYSRITSRIIDMVWGAGSGEFEARILSSLRIADDLIKLMYSEM